MLGRVLGHLKVVTAGFCDHPEAEGAVTWDRDSARLQEPLGRSWVISAPPLSFLPASAPVGHTQPEARAQAAHWGSHSAQPPGTQS